MEDQNQGVSVTAAVQRRQVEFERDNANRKGAIAALEAAIAAKQEKEG